MSYHVAEERPPSSSSSHREERNNLKSLDIWSIRLGVIPFIFLSSLLVVIIGQEVRQQQQEQEVETNIE